MSASHLTTDAPSRGSVSKRGEAGSGERSSRTAHLRRRLPRVRRAVGWSASWFAAHPVAGTFVVALVVRLVVTATYMVFTDGLIIPDELQYLTLGETAASGHLTSALWLGYGESLFHSTAAFMWPLTAAFWVFWPWRGFAILLVAILGAATAAGTTRLGLELLPRRWALAAGAVVAVVPSQVLWSSVVLRESFVWVLLVALALLTTRIVLGRGRTDVQLLLVLAACVGLGYLRQQTMIVAAFAVPVTFLVAAMRGRRLRLVVAGACIAIVAPYLSGCGLAGWGLLVKAVPNLATTRTYLSMNSQSAFVATTVVPTPVTPPGGDGSTSTTEPDSGAGASAIAGRNPNLVGGQKEIVNAATGETYAVEGGVSTDVRALPGGLLAVSLRPYLWEHTSSLPLAFARVEQLAWYGLYALAILGCWAERRRWRSLTSTVVILGGILVIAALTQGNLGTAFRHRGQILWAVALLAACGGRYLVDRFGRRTRPVTAGA